MKGHVIAKMKTIFFSFWQGVLSHIVSGCENEKWR